MGQAAMRCLKRAIMKNIKSLAAGLFIYGIIATMALLVAIADPSPTSPGPSSTPQAATNGKRLT